MLPLRNKSSRRTLRCIHRQGTDTQHTNNPPFDARNATFGTSTYGEDSTFHSTDGLGRGCELSFGLLEAAIWIQTVQLSGYQHGSKKKRESLFCAMICKRKMKTFARPALGFNPRRVCRTLGLWREENEEFCAACPCLCGASVGLCWVFFMEGWMCVTCLTSSWVFSCGCAAGGGERRESQWVGFF